MTSVRLSGINLRERLNVRPAKPSRLHERHHLGYAAIKAANSVTTYLPVVMNHDTLRRKAT
jgi:hypothetical protein